MAEEPIARGMRTNLHPLDEDSASRLLQGHVHPDDAPPGYASVADLLASAAKLPALDEHSGQATISAMVEAVRAGAPAPQTARRTSKLGKIFAGKALVAMATVALTATGAAAATGTLPDPVQNAVAGAVSHMGVDLPGNGGKSADHRRDGENRPSGDQGPGHTGQSGDKGRSGEDHGRPADDGGADDPADHGKGEVISGITHDPALDGQPKGPAVCDVASGGQCQAGDDHGTTTTTTPTTPTEGSGEDTGKKPDVDKGAGDVTPPVTPTTGGIETGAEHSGRNVGASGRGNSGKD
jgi:hypothetical protein